MKKIVTDTLTDRLFPVNIYDAVTRMKVFQYVIHLFNPGHPEQQQLTYFQK